MDLRVDWRQSLAFTGTVVKYLAVAMVVPLVVSLVYREDILVFLGTALGTFLLGAALERLDDDPQLGVREALLFVTLAWVAVAVVGAVPYLVAGIGSDSSVRFPVNALFESTSGFTTTGATVLKNIAVSDHSHAVMIWRQLTQWLGGMGIIVLMVAILPEAAVNGAQLIDSEAPGPELQKLTPKIAETARLLWLFYLGFTVLLVVLLWGLGLLGVAPEMNLYEAVAHAFSTLPTGGFSTRSRSIAAFSPAVQWTIVPFMLVAGTNFALFFYMFNGEFGSFVRNREFQAYIGANVGVALVLFWLLLTGSAPPLDIGGVTQGNLENAARQAAFQVASLLNSTGYATSNFAQWDATAKAVLVAAMFIGGSAGSTGGGVKVIRWLVVLKGIRRQLFTTAHPQAVKPVRLGGQVVDEEALRAIYGFTLLYLLAFGAAALFIALDAHRAGLDVTMVEAATASLATLGNIGPGMGFLGPFGSYLRFPAPTKLLMIGLMIFGRLEIVPVAVVFTGAFWTE